MKNTMTLNVCGFYVKHQTLQLIRDLGAQHCLRFKDLTKQYTNALDNMTGEITLTKGSTRAQMEQEGSKFYFDILSVSDLCLHGVKEKYPELQFGTETGCEFRLITDPSIGSDTIEEFINL